MFGWGLTLLGASKFTTNDNPQLPGDGDLRWRLISAPPIVTSAWGGFRRVLLKQGLETEVLGLRTEVAVGTLDSWTLDIGND